MQGWATDGWRRLPVLADKFWQKRHARTVRQAPVQRDEETFEQGNNGLDVEGGVGEP